MVIIKKEREFFYLRSNEMTTEFIELQLQYFKKNT